MNQPEPTADSYEIQGIELEAEAYLAADNALPFDFMIV